MQNITVVIPVYCEADNLRLVYERLKKVSSELKDYCWEYLFVNDGSPDNSLVVLKQLAAEDASVKVLDLSRNFGKEIALTAGVHTANEVADAVICMDSDLQHPPELIPQLVHQWCQGAEIVGTIRTSIEKQPLLRRIGSHVYYWMMAKISGLDMLPHTTDFRLYDKKVIKAFCLATERERMFRGIMDWLGFHKVYVSFAADARQNGEAGYSYRKLWSLAINSITAFSLWPLRLTGYLGIVISSISSVILLWMVSTNLLGTQTIYTPLAIVVVINTLLMGIVLMAIGLVALYIGNIHTEVINRPLYIVREKVNL
ncbi:MAG: glycosyltransferase family 2 protein [Pseudomonadales bacterium]|nr:glycosyltransferase family 2 protein [Pseudomonadales bacterium]